MSVLIKGLEMPTRCFSCPMCDVENAEVNCAISHGSYIEYRDVDPQIAMQARPEWCPLVEVPPHGDLIDRDALWEHVEDLACDIWVTAFGVPVEALEKAPTVIPADKDGET